MPDILDPTSKEAVTAQCVIDQTKVRLTLRSGEVVIATYHGWSDQHHQARVIMPDKKHQMRRISVDDIVVGGEVQLVMGESATGRSVAVPAPAIIVNDDGTTRSSEFTVAERFEFLESLTTMVAAGNAVSLCVTGSGGLGKSHTVMKCIQRSGLKEDEDYRVYKGFATPKSLYRALYDNREGLVIFDDCDSVLEHATSLNLLKGALDSYDTRRVSWLTERPDPDLPDYFEFKGGVIFISNKNIREIDQPILSRALFVDLTMTVDEKIQRLEMLLPSLRMDVALQTRIECLELLKGVKLRIKDLNIRSLLKCIQIRTAVDNTRGTHVDWRSLATYSLVAG